MSINALFNQPLTVVNVGLPLFAESLTAQHIPVIEVEWRPPAAGVPRLTTTKSGADIDALNQQVIDIIRRSRPQWVGMGLAKDVIPGYHEKLILHSGPPITWDRMCGPQRGAVMGALVYEGLARSEDDAAQLAANGDVEFSPCHHYQTVGPMAGVVSPSMPMFIIENQADGNRAYATQNEGLGKVLRYGAFGEEVYTRLHWMADTLYPALDRALTAIDGGIDLRALISQALHMGDECHNRNRAGTSLLLRLLGPALISTSPAEVARDVFAFIDSNDHFFLNLSMPAAKAMTAPAFDAALAGSSIVTVMARNGTDFGIQLAGLPDEWFTAPAGIVEGLYFPGYSEADANPDIGDSTITETAGFGAFAMAGAPAITKFVGGTPADAIQATLEMYEICFAESDAFSIPHFNFRGTPLGIDVRRIMETGLLPRLNTGIAHKTPGIGQVGAGVLNAPADSFAAAFARLKALSQS